MKNDIPDSVRRDLRLLKIWAAGTTLALGILLLVAFRSPGAVVRPPAPFDAAPGADGFVRVEVADLPPALHALTGWAVQQRVPLESLTVTRPTLEDVYLQLTREADHG